MADKYTAIFDLYFQEPDRMHADAEADLKINAGDLDDNLETQSERYSKWGCLVAVAKSRIEEVKARISEEFWPYAKECARLELRGEKVTIDRVEELAYKNENYRKAAAMKRRYELIYEQLKEYATGMYMRADMLKSRSISKIQEMKPYTT